MTSAMSSQSTRRQAAENDRVGARRPYICLPPNGRFAPEAAIRPCPQLTPSDRARFTKRRREAYEALHPETRAGAAGANARWNADANLAAASFAEDQAEKTGASERVVQRDAERGEKVCDAALDLIRGTKFDTGGSLPVDNLLTASKKERHFTQAHRSQATASEQWR